MAALRLGSLRRPLAGGAHCVAPRATGCAAPWLAEAWKVEGPASGVAAPVLAAPLRRSYAATPALSAGHDPIEVSDSDVDPVEMGYPKPPEELLDGGEWGTDEFVTDNEHGFPSAAVGDRVADIPPSVLEELSNPFDLRGVSESSDDEFAAGGAGDAGIQMTAAERAVNEQRKQMKRLVEDPIPIPDKPLWPLWTCIVRVDQVQNTTPGGMKPSMRVLAMVGNMHGAAGFGIGKHTEAAQATKKALRNARRDMIHVSTHKGQLYHDLVGKKNNTMVLVRTLPPSMSGTSAKVIEDVFEFMGIKHAAAKIVGSKRRNHYNVVQALFDAFHHHTPPEDDAFKRGLRMQWMGADRHNPRNFYPAHPKGPRYAPSKHSNFNR